MSCEVKFSPSYLEDFSKLKSLFTGEQELLAIKSFAALEENKEGLRKGEITWTMLTLPFVFTSFLALKALASIASIFSFSCLDKKLALHANHIPQNFYALISYLFLKERLILPTLNDYQTHLTDVYCLPSIPKDQLTHPVILHNLHPQLTQLSFSQIGKGLCHGGVHFYNFLLLRRMQPSSSLYKEAFHVAKLFEKGQPRQAALIQTLYGLEHALLDIQDEVTRVDSDQSTDEAFLLKSLAKLSCGTYNIKLAGHSIAYAKSGKEQIVWDPEVGLIHIQTTEQLLDTLRPYLQKEEAIFFAKQTLYTSLWTKLCSMFGHKKV